MISESYGERGYKARPVLLQGSGQSPGRVGLKNDPTWIKVHKVVQGAQG